MPLSPNQALQIAASAVHEVTDTYGPPGPDAAVKLLIDAADPDDPTQVPVNVPFIVGGLQLRSFYAFSGKAGFDKDALWTALEVDWQDATETKANLPQPATWDEKTALSQLGGWVWAHS